MNNNKKSKKKKNNILKRIILFLKNERFKYSLGAVLVFFAIFLSIAFISYLFTWHIDQSKLNIQWSEFIFNSNINVDNWAGKTGALLSHIFIHRWFGFASFSIIFILILTGFRLWNIKLLPYRKSVKTAILSTIWLSFTLGYIFGQKYFFLGGAHGYFLSKWFTSFAGNIGTILTIIITLFIFTIASFKNTITWINNLFKTKEEEDATFDDNNNDNTIVEDIDDEKPKEIEFDINDNESIIESDNKQEIIFETENTNITEENSSGENSIINEEPANEIEMTVETKNEEEESGKIENKPVGDYDPTLDLSLYKLPPIDLLADHKSSNSEVSDEELQANKNKIIETLLNYKIKIDKIKATIGPTITLYEIVPAPGVRISKIKNLEDDIALSLSALGIRIIAPIPGRGTIGIEVPNINPEIVSMRTIIASKKFQEANYDLPVVLGKTISNEVFAFDLAKMPHLLVAGATGQGKSVGLNAIISSLLYKKHPANLKFVMIDPKKVELTLYSRIEKHFLAKLPDEDDAIITDTSKVVATLSSLTIEMENRYELLKKSQLRNIKEYNHKYIKRKLNPNNGHKYLPYIVVIIDEFADLIMTAGKEVEAPIARIAQLARAVGIHLIIATQRPSANIITGMIKANFPARIAFKVVSAIDSRTILDATGANQLIGKGDMLFSQGSNINRVQCAFIDTPEVEKVCDYIAGQQGPTEAMALPEPETETSDAASNVDLSKRDSLFEEAARIVVMHQQGSTSLIQRKLSIGYNRSGRIIDQLEAAGIVGPFEGSKARQVLIPDEYSLEQFLNNL